MLKQNMQFAVHAPTAGYEDLTQWVTDYTGTPGVNVASRNLVGRPYVWKVATTSYMDGSLDGYVLQDEAPRLVSIFSGSEKALWVQRYPNGRVFVFRSYVPDSAITADDGVQVLDVPLASTEGYLTAKTHTAESGTAIPNMPANAYLFYWIRETIPSLTQLNFDVEYAGTPGNDIQLPNQPFVPGLYLVPVGNTIPFPTANISIEYQGVAYDNEVEFAIGALK